LAGYLLLTGSTGLLGQFLVRDLLAKGHRLALLVRGSKHETAAERIEKILQRWERKSGARLPRPVILEGDIRQPFLGLNATDLKWVRRHCNALMHSAASLKFLADGTGEPWISNLDGTTHMLSLCKASGIRNLHYVSTAYVCGLREGIIYESELQCGQSFRNDYEESKLKAEMLIRQADFIDELTIYRPAVIAGDSQTGYTNTYHGIYLYLRLMALLVPRQPIGPDGRRQTRLRLPMTGDERRNIIPVDWVSNVIASLYTNKNAHGHTFHLAPDQCLTPRQIIEAGYNYFNSTGVEYAGYAKIDPATYNDFEAEMLPAFGMYNNYESTDPHFDCSNLKRFASGIPCPAIDEKMLQTFIRYGEKDRWGKRRHSKAHVDYSASEYFRKFPTEDVTHPNNKSRVSLDLSGPGGGQWTLWLHKDGTVKCERGLNSEPDSLVRLPTDEFHRTTLSLNGSMDYHAIEQFFPMSVKTFMSTVNTPTEPEPANR
jgi:thioester reductase-like protein